MNSLWTWVLLAVSVAFNLFFVVGYAQSNEPATGLTRFEQRARWWADKLKLDPQQQGAFERLLAETVQERKKIREINRPKRERLLAELLKDAPDEKVLLAWARSDMHPSRRELMVRYMSQFVAILTPEQRHLFVDSIRARWRR